MDDIFSYRLNEIAQYRDLQDVKIASNIIKDAKSRQLLVINNSYEINSATTVAIFDFSSNPIEGQFRSLIFDLNDHLVLTQQSSRQLINTIFHNNSVGGMIFQKIIANMLGHKYLNTISLGGAAYFSLKGFSTGNIHWVALHLLKNYHYSHENDSLSFEILNLGIKITWTNVKYYVIHRLRESLKHNQMISFILQHHLMNHLSLQYQPINKTALQSILYHCDLIDPYFEPQLWHITDIVEELCSQYIISTVEYLNREFGIPIPEGDLKLLVRKVMRNRYNN